MSSVPTGPGNQCPSDAGPPSTYNYALENNTLTGKVRLLKPMDITEYADYYFVAQYDDNHPANLVDWYISDPIPNTMYGATRYSFNWDGAMCGGGNGNNSSDCVKKKALYTYPQQKNKQDYCCIV